MLLGAYTGGALVSLLGCLLPCYRTFKSFSEKDEDQSAWLTFWMIFAVFSTVEVLLDMLLWWFPLYYELKVTFVLVSYALVAHAPPRARVRSHAPASSTMRIFIARRSCNRPSGTSRR